MNRNFIFLAILGFGLILLIVNHDSGQVFGLENNLFASVLFTGVWVAVISASVFYSGISIGQMAKQLAIWLVIILTLMNVYLYRYELQDIGSRMTAGLIPGSPISQIGENGKAQVTLLRTDGRHFQAKALINGMAVTFLVDTGASFTTLSHEDAKAVGIDMDTLVYNAPISTANGLTTAARITVRNFSIGEIFRDKLRVYISRPGQLNSSLLGMNFLETLSAFEVRGDRMILKD